MPRNTPFYSAIWLFSLLLILPFYGTTQDLTHVPGAFLIKPVDHSKIDEVLLDILTYPNLRLESKIICTLPFPIWLIQTDAALHNEYDLLKYIKSLSSVDLVQFNHILKDRLIPDDPQLPFQWQYINTGSGSGTPNADLDADLAWNLTTGGLTESGDTIVVCVIDEGLDSSHPDLGNNLWYNFSEIPNNNIDDDENGYVDDYKGWNVATSNDELENGSDAGWHGTPVAGIIGAKGNNGIGVTGINWDVKIMTVVRGSTMDQTLAAYAYPFAFRKKYNETNGDEGAFVVATNSSWGINFGLPEEAPLWCALYDSLGSVGILNSAATANGNYDVDQLGDLPTACPSDFLISVTNIDHNDQKNTNAAFGLNTIDLGSYGTNIWTIKKNNSYGSFTGTSAASPSVAGAIALLYAAPCPDISWFAKHDPAATAQIIKSYLINGTTAIPSLSGNTVSGGRLNLKTSLDLLLEACAFTDCFAPVQVQAIDLSETYGVFNWLSAPNVSSVDFRYREVGNSIWIESNNANTPFFISGFSACTTYEYQLKSNCDSESSAYSILSTFKTEGCCDPPTAVEVLSLSGNAVSINWAGSSSVNSYNVRYRAVGSPSWIESNTASPSIVFSNLESCTDYEMQVQSNCAATTTAFSESFIWQTGSCDNCQEFNYCPVSVSPDPFTWISYFQLNDLEHSSAYGMNGYSDFTGQTAMLAPGISYGLNIETAFDFLEIPLYFQLWIDLNQNGIFEDAELLLESSNPTTFCQTSLHIPFTAITGTTRLRIAGREEPGEACGESVNNGEVEDYCVTIIENTACIPPQGLSSTVTEDQITLSWQANLSTQSFEIFYREVNETTWQMENTLLHLVHIENLNSCTDYEYKVRANCDGEHSFFTPIIRFRTLGCGSCLDLDYCIPVGGNTNFEWIANFSLHTINNESEGHGYCDFSNSNATDLFLTNSYNLEIRPGFEGDVYEEVYTVWIDFNQDGSFSDLSEQVFSTPYPTTDAVINGSISIPAYALEGATRLRVMMKYYDAPTSACENSEYFGETEDYCISILSSSAAACNTPVGISAMPLSDTSAYLFWTDAAEVVSYQSRYRDLGFSNWITHTNQNAFTQLHQLTPCQDYEFQVRSICENGMSPYSDAMYFSTDCITTATEFIEGDNSREKHPFVFPNPFENTIFIRLGEEISDSESVSVYNSVGQLYRKFDQVLVQDGLLELDLNDARSGVYFIEINGFVLKVVRM